MIRLLLLLFVASIVFNQSTGNVDSDDLKMLEDLEDLILKDGNIRAYFDQEEAGYQTRSRTPELLLEQFNSANRSPTARRKLRRFREKLQTKKTAIFSRLTQDDVEELTRTIDAALGESARQTTCDTTTKFRTMDGRCNSLDKPEMGSRETKLIRIVDNAYDDDHFQPHISSVNGGPLPNARAISLAVFDGNTRTTDGYTSLGVHFGQITDHDLTAVDGQDVTCTACEVANECFPIILDNSDPVFGGVRACFPFKRSHFEDDGSGVRQQVNSITTWLDASFVYGSDDSTRDQLKYENGSMKHVRDGQTGRHLLPPDINSDCAGVFCALAGDGRVAEQPGLTALHTLFLREHNRIAEALHNLNPSLSGLEVYQRARKIVGAEWQHIMYNEYLPQITGVMLYDSNNLSATAPYSYDQNIDASNSNLFAAAAFRFGHTEVPDKITRAKKDYKVDNIPEILMSEAFFNATYVFDESIRDGALDSILRGMAVQKLDLVDEHLTSAITDNMFGNPNIKGNGVDLVSLNIQRGRDHGLPSYTTIRESFCRMDPINNYDDLMNVIEDGNIEKLQVVYGVNGVKDIDPFVGLILERHLPNTVVGPTLACIFADQFRRLKFGDRFFYQNPDQFTEAQTAEVAKVTMARLMCDNVEEIKTIQPFVFVAKGNFQTPGERGYDSFYEYSRSGDWPHQRSTILDRMNNSQIACTQTSQIPEVNLNVFADN